MSAGKDPWELRDLSGENTDKEYGNKTSHYASPGREVGAVGEVGGHCSNSLLANAVKAPGNGWASSFHDMMN